MPAAVPEPSQDQVFELVTSLRHPRRAMALERERKQLSTRRASQQTLPLSARGGADGTTSSNLSFPKLSGQNAGGTDRGFNHNTSLRASGGPTECQFPDMKSAAAAETAAMLCKHAAEAGTLKL